MIIRPMLVRKNGWCDILSTANGFDHFYDLFEAAKNDPDWAWMHAPSTIAPWWTPDQVKGAMASMSTAEYAQEILAEFRDLKKGKVYLSHGEWNWKYSSPFAADGAAFSPHLPITVGLDFNVGHMAWHLGQFRGETSHWHDRIYVENTNTQECSTALVEKLRGHAPGVELIGDSSGESRRSSATESDYAIVCKALKDAAIKFRNLTPEANPTQKDRVNTMNMVLRAADGSVRFTYDPKACPELKKDFDRVVWKENDVILDKTDPELTHASDSVGYPVCVNTKTWRPSPGLIRVVHR